MFQSIEVTHFLAQKALAGMAPIALALTGLGTGASPGPVHVGPVHTGVAQPRTDPSPPPGVVPPGLLQEGGALVGALPHQRSDEAVKDAAATPSFEESWRLYQTGKPSYEAFVRVLADEGHSDKDRFNAAYVLAVQSLSRSEGEKALGFLDRANSILPGRLQVALRRVDTFVHLGRLEDAKRVFEGLAVDESTSPTVRKRHALTKARLMHAQGESDVAIELLVRLAEEHPTEWEAFYLMGLVYESFDIPEDAMRAYERTMANDPKRDPFPGIYAYQRWSALAISTDPNSYNDKPKKTVAIARYQEFLKRAAANRVPEPLIQQAEAAVSALENFGT